MKKINCFLLVSFFVFSSGLLQAQPFQKGTSVVSFGVGLGSSLLNYSGSNQTPALSVQFEKGVWQAGDDGVVSIGAYGGFKSYKYSNKSAGYSEKWTYTILGVRGAYHYNGFNTGSDGLSKIDVYGGVMLSYNILNYKYNDNGYTGAFNSGGYGSAAGFTGFVGGRYFFSKNIAAMAELGYGVSYLTLGIALKF